MMAESVAAANATRLSDKLVAITGGAGLIGSFLCDELVQYGARVIVVDDFSKGRRENIAHLGSRIEVREGDLECSDFALKALADSQVIFHLASRAYGIGYAKGRHTDILQHNERITDNVLEAVARNRPQHVLITSSSCVYDDAGPDTVPELPLFEGAPEMANWGYGWAKRFLEQKALIYARETGVRMTIVRPFNIYGERYNWVGESSSAIPMLVKKVMDGDDPVVIWGSGQQRRNYMHASDCARAMLGLVEAGHTDGPVNIGGKETVSLRQLVEMICVAGGHHPMLAFDTTKPEGRFIKSADDTKLCSVLPEFGNLVGLTSGLDRMIGWYRATFGSRS